MPDSEHRAHLVCYDIADPKRLGRLHRFLVKQAIPLQYSVFMLYATRPAIVALMGEIAGLIKADEDDVRCYPLPSTIDFHNLGRQLLPDGALLLDADLQLDLFRNRARGK